MEIRRLFDITYYQQKNSPLKQSLSGLHVNGKNYSYSTDEFVKLVNKVSLGLLQMGVKPGDKIALISYNNRPEWNIMDIGMMQIGAINVPVYPTISPSDYIYIFNDASVKYCIVGHGDLLEKVKTAQKEIPSLQAIFTFDEADSKGQTDAHGAEVHHWERIFSDSNDFSAVDQIKQSVKSEDIATIIYTSGTTGNPKGVCCAHAGKSGSAQGLARWSRERSGYCAWCLK
jgi:long-chain acyl-CoA synthetase